MSGLFPRKAAAAARILTFDPSRIVLRISPKKPIEDSYVEKVDGWMPYIGRPMDTLARGYRIQLESKNPLALREVLVEYRILVESPIHETWELSERTTASFLTQSGNRTGISQSFTQRREEWTQGEWKFAVLPPRERELLVTGGAVRGRGPDSERGCRAADGSKPNKNVLEWYEQGKPYRGQNI